MKTPTLEEVKKHFENAKEVKCLSDGKEYNISRLEIEKGKYSSDSYLAKDEKGIAKAELCYKNKYAEIISYKDTFTVDKEFIKEAYDNPELLKEKFPSVFEGELEAGKWYIAYWYTVKYLVCIKNIGVNIETNGFNITEKGKYTYLPFDKNYDYKWSLAPDKEVEEALKSECEKLGFKKGSKVKHILYSGKLSNEERILDTSNFYYDAKDNSFDCENKDGQRYRLFKDGKFATIISEPIELTMEQIAEKFNVDVNLLKIKK